MVDSFAYLATTPALYILFAVFLGLMVGSFLNVVIYRVPKMLDAQWQLQCAELRNEPIVAGKTFNLFFPPSSCPACDTRIAPWHNIPVFGWLWLRGRCASCSAPISRRYPIIEAISGALAGVVAWQFGFHVVTLLALAYAWTLLALAVIDLDTFLLPDAMTLPLLWLGLLANVWGLFAPLSSAVLGAVAGYLSLWGVYWLFRLATGKEGMGYGDFKLFAAIGAWFGWAMLPAVILLSAGVGVMVGLAMMTRGGSRHQPIPFGPYLAGGGLAALFWGQDLVRLYFG